MIDDTLIRKGDGVTQTWVLSPANTDLVSVKVDGVSVAFTRPTWNTVKLQVAPTKDAEVAFDFTGAVPPNAVTALESRVATLELMQGTGGDNELELEMIVLSDTTVIADTYPRDPDMPEAGTETLYIYNVDNISPTVRKLLLHITSAEGYVPPPSNIIVRLPVGFDGVLSVVNMTDGPIDLRNQASIEKGKDWYATPVNAVVNYQVVPDTHSTFIYRDAPDGELLSFQRSAFMPFMETQNVTFIGGNAASSTVFQRVGTGVTKLGSIYVEGNSPSHAMTVTATLESFNLSGSGFIAIAVYTATVPAGSQSSFGFSFVSGFAPNPDGFTGHTAGRIRYTISYAGTPTRLASDVQILSATKTSSDGQLVLIP